MQPSYQAPQKFSDFQPDYIATLAQQNGFTYVPASPGDTTESSIFNNPKTDTTELYKQQLNIAGLKCEYYTADYLPLLSRDMPQFMQGTNVPPEHQFSMRTQVQVFSIDLAYAVENLYVESRTNVTLTNILGLKSAPFKDSKTVQLEGDFSYFFRAYVPRNEELSAFTILAPNIMLHLLADGGDYDFEFSGSKIYFYKTFGLIQVGTIPLKKADYDRMLTFGIKSAALLARASRPAKLAATSGVPEMWQLYGMSKGQLNRTIGLIIASFLLISICVTNPLLWPLAILIALFFYIKRRSLLKKREKLVREWQNK
jgi:hypothetical protein